MKVVKHAKLKFKKRDNSRNQIKQIPLKENDVIINIGAAKNAQWFKSKIPVNSTLNKEKAPLDTREFIIDSNSSGIKQYF